MSVRKSKRAPQIGEAKLGCRGGEGVNQWGRTFQVEGPAWLVGWTIKLALYIWGLILVNTDNEPRNGSLNNLAVKKGDRTVRGTGEREESQSQPAHFRATGLFPVSALTSSSFQVWKPEIQRTTMSPPPTPHIQSIIRGGQFYLILSVSHFNSKKQLSFSWATVVFTLVDLDSFWSHFFIAARMMSKW